MATIILDLENDNIYREDIEVKQDDTKDLEIIVYKNNREFNLDGFDITINGVNSNGDGIIQNNDISVSNINHIDTILMNSFTRVPGLVLLEVELKKDNLKITTFTFKMMVAKGLLRGANLSPILVIDNIERLTNLIAETRELLNKK